MPCLITDEQKIRFASAFLLEKMVHDNMQLPVYLEGNDRDLEPVLEYMMSKNWVLIENKKCYICAKEGNLFREQFSNKYRDFLRNFDIYCAVDLAAGEFAFARFFDFDSDDAWKKYVQNSRWDDLRVAVSQYKKLNPVEIVFMNFLQEERFSSSSQGWQFDLLLGSMWDEIATICTTAISVDELGYSAEDGTKISGESVIRDIITQGSQLTAKLFEQEAHQKLSDGVSEQEIARERHSVKAYATDPCYAAPCWKQ